ncbi:MAG: transposase [Leptolyngbya sp. Prado105]|nr:transposase [Leptolyngbya sp. Prado105]
MGVGWRYFITFNTWKKFELSFQARQIALDTCLFFNNQRYKVFIVVVMPDHVHLIVQPLLKTESKFWSLSEIMKSMKGYSAKKIAAAMNHIGVVWQDERYDRIVRDAHEFENFWNYIRLNPVRAGLSETPEQYPFLWQQPSLDLSSNQFPYL